MHVPLTTSSSLTAHNRCWYSTFKRHVGCLSWCTSEKQLNMSPWLKGVRVRLKTSSDLNRNVLVRDDHQNSGCSYCTVLHPKRYRRPEFGNGMSRPCAWERYICSTRVYSKPFRETISPHPKCAFFKWHSHIRIELHLPKDQLKKNGFWSAVKSI